MDFPGILGEGKFPVTLVGSAVVINENDEGDSCEVDEVQHSINLENPVFNNCSILFVI